jgi:uncharacterized protein YaaR (DUF327 family)
MIIANKTIKSSSEKDSKPVKSGVTAKIKEQANSFLSILEKLAPSTNEETKEINELWQQLPDAERNFLDNPNHENLTLYKNLVKSITQEILKKNMTLVQAKQRGRSDKKILMTVKIIDENLQILATTMLNPSNSAFTLLKQVERIRGLLMDINQ